MDFDQEELEEKKYTEAYSEEKLFDKIMKFAKKAGIKVIYLALLLYYTLQQPETPMKAKSVIIGALGYFIFPVDLIPDFIPVAGYTDDLTALMAALVMVAFYINEDTKKKAKERLKVWFGSYDESDLRKIDEKMNTAIILAKIIKIQKNKNILKKISLQGNEIEIFEEG